VRILLLIGLIGLLLVGCTKSDTGVLLQGISFQDSVVTVNAGTTIQLIPVFKPVDFTGIPVVWASSDPNMATVTPNGLVYTLNRGKVWVSIKDKNSSTTGKCHITIQ